MSKKKIDFDFILSVFRSALNIGDYKLEISRKSISKFTHLNHPLTYFVALEPDSNFEDLDNTNEKGKVLEPKPRKSSK